jgi:hypothetical protein
MTMGERAIQRAESAPQIERRDVIEILMTGDLGRLNPEQAAWYYVHECERMGLDPAARPLEWMNLQGKRVLYSKRIAGDMLAAKHRVSVALVTEPEERTVGGVKLLFARARATMPDGRFVEDVGTVAATGDVVNGIMKCATKAERRATLRLCGWGGLDESELDTLPAARVPQIHAREPVATLAEPEPDPVPPAVALFREHIAHARESIDQHGEVTVGSLTYAQAAAIWIDHREGLRKIDPQVATDGWKELLAFLPDPGGKKTRHAELNRAVLAAEPKGPPPTGTEGPRAPANDTPAEDPERAAIEAEAVFGPKALTPGRAWIQRAAGFRVVERALASWAAHRGEWGAEYDQVEEWFDAWLRDHGVDPDQREMRKREHVARHQAVLARQRAGRVRQLRDRALPFVPAKVA